MRRVFERMVIAAILAAAWGQAAGEPPGREPPRGAERPAPPVARDNPFAPVQPSPAPSPPVIKSPQEAHQEELDGLSYVGRVDGKDVYLFKEGRCYVQAQDGRFADSGCRRAHQRFVRDHPGKR